MLEKQDCVLLKEMMQDVVGSAITANNEVLEEKLGRRIDEAIAANNIVIGRRIDEAIAANNIVIGKRIDEAIAANNIVIGKRIDEAITKSESFLLDEIERYYKIIKEEIRDIRMELKKLDECYRTLRQEADTSNALFRLYERQQEEIDSIKKAIAI